MIHKSFPSKKRSLNLHNLQQYTVFHNFMLLFQDLILEVICTCLNLSNYVYTHIWSSGMICTQPSCFHKWVL